MISATSFELMTPTGIVSVEIRRKRMRTIRLRVLPDGRVVLSAPRSVPAHVLKDFLSLKSGWISAALEKAEKSKAVGKDEIDRKAVPKHVRVFGQTYPVDVIASAERNISFSGKSFEVRVRESDTERTTAAMIDRWLRSMALSVFQAACDKHYPKVEHRSSMKPEIRVRDMKSSYGICKPDRRIITFALRLLEEDPGFIDYVALHELAHLKHPNHQAEFKAFLDEHMPDWRKRKAQQRSILLQGKQRGNYPDAF